MWEIADLTVLHRYSSLSPYYGVYGSVPEPVTVQTVGWLGDRVPTTGELPAECIERLFDAYEAGMFEPWGGLGPHICEVCLRENGVTDYDGVIELSLLQRLVSPAVHSRGRTIQVYGHGHHFVRLGNRVFVCPVLILHYILDHGYRPPTDFLDAGRAGNFIRKEDVPARRTL